MTNHWKMLGYSGTTNMLKDAGVLKLSPMSFTVCHGNVVLKYEGTNTFADIRNQWPTGANTDVWIVGSGVHQMVTFGKDETLVFQFAKWLDALQSQSPSTRMVYVGTHHRIIELAPTPYRGYAEGPQGNLKIKRWNQIFNETCKHVPVVDPYSITEALDLHYGDTEDGMHFGFWVNLQKVQLVLASLNQHIQG
jgi:hypothetical protein